MVSPSKAGKTKTKVVTIRNVKQVLFERFTSLTKVFGKNTGSVFSSLLENYRLGENNPTFVSPFEQHIFGSKKPNFEYLENLPEITIEKKHFSLLARPTKFIFQNVNKIVFTSNISNELVLKYIYRFWDCGAIEASNVADLVIASLVRERIPLSPSKSEVKDVTIRKVSTDIYNRFVATCKLLGKNVGEATSEFLQVVIPEMELNQILAGRYSQELEGILVISSLQKKVITRKDLDGLGDYRVIFHRILNLEFADDIPSEIFSEKVLGVYNCNNVKLPSEIPDLLSLAKIKDYPAINKQQ